MIALKELNLDFTGENPYFATAKCWLFRVISTCHAQPVSRVQAEVIKLTRVRCFQD